MSLNTGDQGYNNGKKYGQKGTICGPNITMPARKRALQNKWVYKLKEEYGGKNRYKARLVVKGFAQKKGIYFDEIFSPVVKMTSIRTILSLVSVEDLHLEQLDVKTTVLHGYF
jgi:acyl-CoA reductase-like NAD-dependent aldehyde dehydrogenase